MTSITLTTSESVAAILSINNVINFYYEGGTFSNESSMNFKRGSFLNDATLNETSDSQSNSMTFKALKTNQNVGIITIDFLNYRILMPSSASPKDFLFTFYTDSSQQYRFMEIGATLQAQPVVIQPASISVSADVTTIGDKASYNFLLTTAYPLSSSPKIILTFP